MALRGHAAAPKLPHHATLDTAVAALSGCPAVRARLEALATASCSLVLFGEYIPHSMLSWLREDPAGKAATVERQLSQIVMFLRGRKLLHMDGHFGNMRTNGERIYLSDFGLATSPHFDLSAAERDFAQRNATHDAGYAAMRLVNWLVPRSAGYRCRPAAAQSPATSTYSSAPLVTSQMTCQQLWPLLTRHAPAAAKMNTFYWRLFGGDIHAEYPGL